MLPLPLCGVPLWNSVSSVVKVFVSHKKKSKAFTTEDTEFHRGNATEVFTAKPFEAAF
jgi:hypothetical protein